MSLDAYALAVRNKLRASLTDFYGTDLDKAANCRITTPKYPCSANCGREFIGIWGASHKPRQATPYNAFEEEFGLVVGVTLRINDIPADHRGEAGYMYDDTKFSLGWRTIANRCREIVGLIAGHTRYEVMQAANTILDTGSPITEPLVWLGTDAAPQEVGADHFLAYHETSPIQSMVNPIIDDEYGLFMRVNFGRAVRFQPHNTYDSTS